MRVQDWTTLTYIFERKGEDILFRRVRELGSDIGSQNPPPAAKDTEQPSVANLKALVENSLWREVKGRYLP